MHTNLKTATEQALDDLLIDWHKHCASYQTGGYGKATPMCRNAKSSRGWDSIDDIADSLEHAASVEAVDFQISQMAPEHRTALGMYARNLVTGVAVWASARLPDDPIARTVVLTQAKQELTRRLKRESVIL